MHSSQQKAEIPPNFAHDTPAAPIDCRVANRLPAGTAPPNEAIHPAAHEPAAIPVDVNPRRGKIAYPSAKVPPPITPMQLSQHTGPPINEYD